MKLENIINDANTGLFDVYWKIHAKVAGLTDLEIVDLHHRAEEEHNKSYPTARVMSEMVMTACDVVTEQRKEESNKPKTQNANPS
jgi:oligoendopeptidase F